MKKIMLLSIFLLYTAILFSATRTFSSKENYYKTWWKLNDGSTGAYVIPTHVVGARNQGGIYTCRSFQYWEWSYSQIPSEAVVQSVNIKFRAVKDDNDNSFHYSFHNIAHKQNEVISFYNECVNANKIYENTSAPINDQILIDLTFTSQSPVGNGYEVWSAIQNAIQNENYYFTLGIQEVGSQLTPAWTLTAYDGFDEELAAIDLTITYTINDPTVTIQQKLSTGTSVGTLKKWEGSAFGQPFNPGSSFSFMVGSTQTIQATQNLYSNQKYNNWNGYSNINNHKSFIIRPSLNLLTANLAPTYSGVIIRNYIEESVIGGGSIEFKDPWLNDYADLSFANTLRNRDSLAVFYSRQSPFNSDYSTSYGSNTYKGVFLNEFNVEKSIYSLRTLLNQDIYLSQTNRTHKCYFQNWSGTGVTFYQNEINPTGYDQKDVAFTSSSAVANANLKGTQLSNTASAFTNSSQRKLVRTKDNWLHQGMSQWGMYGLNTAAITAQPGFWEMTENH